MTLHKNRFIYLIVIMSLFIVTNSAFAQSQESSSDYIVAKMKRELKLSDEQVKQIKPIIENEIQQRQQIKEQARAQGIDRQAIKEQMQALRKDTESRLAQYFTQDQMAQWENEQQLKDRLNNDENPTGGGSGGGHSGHHGLLSLGNSF
jgi:regulatory protein YycI of two-component signal transduction system YycFG